MRPFKTYTEIAKEFCMEIDENCNFNLLVYAIKCLLAKTSECVLYRLFWNFFMFN